MFEPKRLTDRDAAVTVAEMVELVIRVHYKAVADAAHVVRAQSVRASARSD